VLPTSATGDGYTSSPDGKYAWKTSDTSSYLCASNMDLTGREIACAQGSFDSTSSTNAEATATLSCSTGTIECMLFTGYGSVGGSCAGDPFYVTSEAAYLPESVFQSECSGKASCAVTGGVGTLNGIENKTGH
jgi:hypothetical protein